MTNKTQGWVPVKMLAMVAGCFVGLSAQAQVVVGIGDGWHEFTFGDTGSNWNNYFTLALSSTTTFNVKVTDVGDQGDRFRVSLYQPPSPAALSPSPWDTSTPQNIDGGTTSDYDTAFASEKWSSGAWTVTLNSGTYAFLGQVIASGPGKGGSGGIELVAVPEPASAAVFASLGMLGFALLRHARKS